MFPKSAPPAAAPEPETNPPRQRRPAKLPRRFSWRPLIALIVLAALIYLAYGYVHTKHQLDRLSNPKIAAESATQQLVDKVSRLVQLPTGETPTIATVNDAAKLKNQAFFANAKDGDKVLIYSKANRAVLYRPSADRVIEFSSVNLTGGTGQ
jgi:hypothetical protein